MLDIKLNRLAYLLGAMISSAPEDIEAKENLPDKLVDVRDLCVARNCLLRKRNRVLEFKASPLTEIQRMCDSVQFNLFEDYEGLPLDAQIDGMFKILEKRIGALIAERGDLIEKWTGIEFVDLAKLFKGSIHTAKDYWSFPMPESSWAPKGIILGCIPKGVIHNLMFRSPTYFLKVVAQSKLWKPGYDSLSRLLGLFVESGTPVYMYLDGDNLSYNAVAVEENALSQMQSIKEVKIYTDASSTPMWNLMSSNAKFEVSNVKRIVSTKSLVDMSIAQDVITKRIQQPDCCVVLCSSDSDYFPIVSSPEGAPTIVVYQLDRVKATYVTQLAEVGVLAIPIEEKEDAETRSAMIHLYSKSLIIECIKTGKLAGLTMTEVKQRLSSMQLTDEELEVVWKSLTKIAASVRYRVKDNQQFEAFIKPD